MSFLENIDCKNGLLRVRAAVLHKLTTERNQRHVGSSGGEFSQRWRNAQGGTTADGRGNSSVAWNGALKLRKQTAIWTQTCLISWFQGNQWKLRHQGQTWSTTIYVGSVGDIDLDLFINFSQHAFMSFLIKCLFEMFLRPRLLVLCLELQSAESSVHKAAFFSLDWSE